ncbi:MAG: hypothetical protein ABI286_07780 [Edaphobacter sp.]
MKNRIAIWAAVGFIVAGCWELYAATSPSAIEQTQSLWIIARITCPITFAVHLPLNLYAVLIVNTVIYALIGLIVETLRERLNNPRIHRF